MTTPVIIRELNENDIPTAAKLLHEMWIQHAQKTKLLDTEYIKNYKVPDYLKRSIGNPKSQTFVAEVDGKVVAVASLEIEDNLPGMYGVDKMAYFDDLVVDPAYRHHGIASQLIESRLQFAKQNNIKVCYSKIYKFNEAAQNLMEKNGFENIYDFYYKFL